MPALQMIDLDAKGTCACGATATLGVPSLRVKLSGSSAMTLISTFTATPCQFSAAGTPCLPNQWPLRPAVLAARVLVEGQPALVVRPVPMSQNAMPVLIVPKQIRAYAS